MPGLPLELAPLNRQLNAFGELPTEAWHEWLWGTDPEAPYHPEVLLNRNHLLGLLVCRYKSLKGVGPPEDGTAYYAAQNRLSIMDKPVASMTWRELKDTVANLLIEWPAFLTRLVVNIRARQNLRQVLHLVNQCAMRFGDLAYQEGAGTDVLDDINDAQPAGPLDPRLVLTPGALRRMVGSLLVLFRHLHLLSMSRKARPAGEDSPASLISKYCYEASNDQFNLLCMHVSLPVAARLNYRHDFPGMYNHVSQVVYFHDSEYTRIARHPLADIRNAPPVHVLPAVQELYPEIGIRYEEDHFDPTRPGQGWWWLVLAGRVYMLTPEPAVLHSDNLLDMLQVYIEEQANKKK